MIVCIHVSVVIPPPKRTALRVNGWPVAAGSDGGALVFARLERSLPVLADWSLTTVPTGPDLRQHNPSTMACDNVIRTIDNGIGGALSYWMVSDSIGGSECI